MMALFAIVFAPYVTYAQSVYRRDSSRKTGKVLKERKEQFKTDFFLRTELYFGMSKPDGEISEDDFTAFLNQIISPKFPEGLTVLGGIGQFKDSEGAIIREKSKVLILLYPFKNRKESNRKIELIRAAYKKKFCQQSVLRIDVSESLNVSF